MTWEIRWKTSAKKRFKKLGKHEQKRILDYLESRIATHETPYRFGKPLMGKLKGLWRYRVDNFRILCRIEDERLVVLVVDVGHRSSIYSS